MVCRPTPQNSLFGIVSSPILPPYGLVISRLIGSAYLATLLIRIIGPHNLLREFVALTNQSLLLSSIYYFAAAAVSIHYLKWNPSEPPKAYKVVSHFQALCVPVCMIVIIGFWTFIPEFDIWNIQYHGLSLCDCFG